MTPTEVCTAMNAVYEMLKEMSIEEIKEARSIAPAHMSVQQAALFQHQCNYALMKKDSGAWK